MFRIILIFIRLFSEHRKNAERTSRGNERDHGQDHGLKKLQYSSLFIHYLFASINWNPNLWLKLW